ncbi:Pentapeptide repeat protein Rfr32 [Porphyridium purpureum]|uniref:Pentapeptide repeat protein Rfr32 n=1 Tax=Porphyridium purpureum TaxID=35688 RepID=A0A5J4Z3F8_PORPP|nr:Pentapeptide repeat protein Rfr32 [Porphyridium purpureum]|eukprot:POR7407..scf295_1
MTTFRSCLENHDMMACWVVSGVEVSSAVPRCPEFACKSAAPSGGALRALGPSGTKARVCMRLGANKHERTGIKEWRVFAAAAALALVLSAGNGEDGRPVLMKTLKPAHAAEVQNYDHNQSLQNEDFSGRDLQSAVFTKANAQGASFKNADLRKANLEYANLMECDLEGADLTYALATKTKLQRASLKNANFTNANLMGASFDRETSIEGADFTDALIEPFMAKKLCSIARGTNPTTGVDTRESLMCQ